MGAFIVSTLLEILALGKLLSDDDDPYTFVSTLLEILGNHQRI